MVLDGEDDVDDFNVDGVEDGGDDVDNDDSDDFT